MDTPVYTPTRNVLSRYDRFTEIVEIANLTAAKKKAMDGMTNSASVLKIQIPHENAKPAVIKIDILIDFIIRSHTR